MLEESPQETMDDLISLMLNKPVRLIKASRQLNDLLRTAGKKPLDFRVHDDLTDEEYRDGRAMIAKMPLYIYDHRGSNAFENIISRIEYMAAALDCDVIILDHITAVVAGLDHNGSEREGIDEVMKCLRSIVERTGVHLDVVTQLNRLEGKAAEEGGQVSLKNLRGSGSLGSVPNNVLAVERNQQADAPEERNIMKVRVLKGRFTGLTGVAGYLKFDHETRRLVQTEWNEQSEGSSFGDETNAETEVQPEQQPDLAGILDERIADATSEERSDDQPSGGPGVCSDDASAAADDAPGRIHSSVLDDL
jgi:twinkle protein